MAARKRVPARFAADARGGVAVLFAAGASVGALLMIMVVTLVLVFLEKRELQALADLCALLAVRDGLHTPDHVAQVIADQGRDPSRYGIEITSGRYAADASLARQARFIAHDPARDAARVVLSVERESLFRGYGPHRLRAEAVAARRDAVAFSLGSRLIRIQGGASGEVLGALLGYDGAITVMDHRALAAARIDMLDFLDALAVEAGITAVSYDEVLDATVTAGAALRAAAQAAGSAAPPRLHLLAAQSARRTIPVPVSDILTLAPGAAPPPGLRGAGMSVSLADIVTATALAASGEREIDLRAATGLARLALGVGERPVTTAVQAFAAEGAEARTRQLSLDLAVGGGLNLVRVEIEDAIATARLIELRCDASGNVTARFEVETSPARARVRGPLGLPGALVSADLSSGQRRQVVLTRQHIASGAPEIVRSGIGAQATLLGLNLPLSALVNNALGAMDGALEGLGLHVAEAELYLRDAQCGRPYLVQ